MRQLFLKACTCIVAVQGIVMAHEKSLSPKESFFLKRITEFWKDKDYTLVKKQITEYLAEHPETFLADNLYAILGDILFSEANYADSFSAYQKIQGTDFKEKTLYRHVISLYELKNFDGIIAISAPFFTEGSTPKIESKEEIQYLLAEAFFKKSLETEDLLQKENFAKQAKPLYQTFTTEQYKELALYPLAELHRTLSEYPQACSLYEILAEKNPSKAEELLFQSATLKLAFDKNGAIETYGRIYKMGGEKSAEAAYNQFVLLFQGERYADLLALEGEIAPHLSQEKNPLFHFCLGRSHYTLGHFDQAAPYLEKYLNEDLDNSAQKKSAFLTLISCAHETNDSTLFDRTMEQLITAYPNDPESAKALLLHAQKALQKENIAQAAHDLNRVITAFPEHEQRENILYDHALLLSQAKNWAESRLSFLSFLEQFPTSLHANLIWSYVLNCSMQELKEASPDSAQEKKRQVVNDLKNCLVREGVFSPEEKADAHFFLCKTLYDLKDYEAASRELETFVSTYSASESIGDGYLMLALSYRELGTAPEKFAENGEKALIFKPEFVDRGLLHLELFNTYLSAEQLDKAADHLFQSYVINETAIQNENQLWLANYYYGQSKAHKENTLATERATLLFKKLLSIENDAMYPQIKPEMTFLEVEALKFAEILPLEKRAQLLSALTEIQNNSSESPWKFQRQALFELGKSYEQLGESDKALKTYSSLMKSSSHSSSYFSFAAELQRDKLLYSHCKDEERNEANPQVIEILSSLKDLQIQKKLLSEPIHLEAALTYADIRATLASPESRVESALFFLNRIKEDFTLKEDALAQEYHEARQKMPEKDALYQSYMKCIEAEMLTLEATLAKQENQLEKALSSKAVAIALLEEVLADEATTPYLRGRAETNLKTMHQVQDEE